jgi:hypothetical protein
MTKPSGLGRNADELAMLDDAVPAPHQYDERIGTATTAELESIK